LQLLLGAFYILGIWSLLSFNNYHNFLAPIGLLGSIIFFFGYALVDRLEKRGLNYCISFAASLLLVCSAGWQFHGKALDLAFLAVALLGISVGFLLKREELRIWGFCILFVSLVCSLVQPYALGDKVFLFNAKFGLMFANTLAMFFVGWLYGKFQ